MQRLEAFGFLNVNKHAGFRNEKLGNRQATKSFEVSSMNAAAATASFSPLFFRGVCDVPALTEASQPLFINKGWLLTDRSFSGFFFLRRFLLFIELLSFCAAKSGYSGLSRYFCIKKLHKAIVTKQTLFRR